MVGKIINNHILSNQMVLIYSLFLFFLTVISLFVPIFVYLVFLFGAVYVLIAKIENSLLLLFFLLPFAGILKYKLGDPSLLSFLMLLFLGVFILQNYKNSLGFKKLIFLPLLFILTLLNNFHLTRVVNIVIDLLFLFFVISIVSDNLLKKIVFIYAIGLFLASIVAFFEPYIPRLGELMRFVVYWLDGGETTIRFTGLENDPNYYAIPIILLLSSILILLKKKQIKEIVFYLYAIPLSIFGILTLSKSFIIIYLIFLLIYVIVIFQIDRKRAFLTIVILFTGAFIGLRFIGFSSFNILFSRLISSFTGGAFDLNILLTGRWGIWKNYWTAINHNWITLLFGNGIGAGYVGGMASHSTYIEILYHFGIIGSLLLALNFFMITFASKRSVSRNLLYYTPLFFLLLLISSLDMIKQDKIFFYLAIALGAIYTPSNDFKDEVKV